MSTFLTKHKPLLNDYARLSQRAGARRDYVQGGGAATPPSSWTRKPWR